MAALPRLALVPGEPAGVGPELCARVAQFSFTAELVAFADSAVLKAGAAIAGVALDITQIALDRPPVAHVAGRIALYPVHCPGSVEMGSPSPSHAPHVLTCLQQAIDACLRGDCDGLVTGPVQKSSINAAGIAFSGTTELLAQHCGDLPVVMMLATPELRVALATTHLPLRAVPDAITKQRLLTGLRVLHTALRGEFGIAQPTIAVLGLNPHAGESGHLGREEIDVIEPVLQQLRAEGMVLIGPLAADTAFLPDKLRGFDAVYAMYHDQGLPVLKASGFERAVNITLGLPFPRVAVDHGTALDIAGRGLADPSSLRAAIDLATRLAGNRRRAA
jgi:4-hydroxythreonine-4-phosphate dehydrogenase